MRTISNVAMVAVALASVAAVGCGNLDDAETTTDEAALSTASNNHGVAACGAPLDPKRDRDHAIHRRCERYGVKHPHRDGRAGGAHVTTRALIDAQGVTTIEATTGDFDDVAAAPGKIEELHVDAARSCPRCRDARSVVAKALQPTGYASTSMTGLARGQALSISARVSGIDRGVDVVSIGDQVRDRPDLVAGGIDVPASATAGLPTSISATVREAAGDEGANADCVLSVDGAAVDRANGIWVDAAGVVTCHFTTSFATPGAHVVAVDVIDVAPRDFDVSNNHAEVSISVAAAFTFSASASDATFAGEDDEDVLDPTGAVSYHRADTWGGRNQSMSLSGTWPTAVTFPLASVKASAASSGTSWSLIELAGLAADSNSDDGSGMTCASGSDASGYDWLSVCASSAGATPATQISISAFTGDVTYHSVGVCQTTSSFYDCAGGYTWNSGSDAEPTTYHAISGSLTFGLVVTDALGTTLSATPSVPMAPYATSDDTPRSCDVLDDGEQHCTSHTYRESGLSGSAEQ